MASAGSAIRRGVLLLLCATGAAAMAMAIEVAGAEEGKGGGAAGDRALVYRIRNGDATVYLAGSIHLLRKSDYPLAAPYDEAYRDSEEIVLEVVQDAKAMAEVQRAMMEKGMLPAGESLKSILSAEHYAVLKRHAEENGLSMSMLDRMRPWLVGLTLAMLEYVKLGATPDDGVDKHFETRAERDGKPTSGLETVEFQLGLFTRLTDEESREMLEQTLNEIDDLETVSRALIDAWKSGDARRLEKLVFKDLESFRAIMERLLFDRNASWVEPIEARLKGDADVMVIVGAGHLVGEKGLVRLLSDKGYVVEQMGAGDAVPAEAGAGAKTE